MRIVGTLESVAIGGAVIFVAVKLVGHVNVTNALGGYSNALGTSLSAPIQDSYNQFQSQVSGPTQVLNNVAPGTFLDTGASLGAPGFPGGPNSQCNGHSYSWYDPRSLACGFASTN